MEVEVRASAIEGLGLFAARPFRAGERIRLVNVVREITAEAPLREELGERQDHCDYPDGRVVLLGFPDRHVNHSCDPNACLLYEGSATWLVARRGVPAAQEITCDYNINITGGTSWPCHCGAARCRGATTGDFFLLPADVQREYRPLLADWFVRRHRDRLGAPASERPAREVIRPAEPADAAAIAAIYNHYVRETVVTFEEAPVTAEEIARRLEDVRSASLPWLVATEGADLVGYACATPWRTRSAYRHSVEITVYVAPGREGRGLGTRLYGGLFPILKARGIHAVMAGIAQPNEASVALHEKFGLRPVARFVEVGFKLGRWIDVGYWQRTL